MRYHERDSARLARSAHAKGPSAPVRSATEFFWRGSPDASPIQRIAAWLFGLMFLIGGIFGFALALEQNWIFGEPLSLLPILIGLRVCRNGLGRLSLSYSLVFRAFPGLGSTLRGVEAFFGRARNADPSVLKTRRAGVRVERCDRRRP
jgi:hypothetical protein